MNTPLGNIARCALSAWIASAAMFVITAVHEVTSPDVPSAVRSQLVLLRFPTYYAFGFTLVPVALVAMLARYRLPEPGKRRSRWALAFVAAALVLMAVDYFSIYASLVEMLVAEAAGEARSSSFQWYHRASELINAAGVMLCVMALIVLSWPVRNNS